MHSLVYTLSFKIALVGLLAIWLGWCGYNVFFREKLPAIFRISTTKLVAATTVFFVLIRWVYSLNSPPNDMDMSTWLASAITVAQSPSPFWTLLNYSDGRPLTVLPLVLVEWVGVVLDFRLAEMVGVLIWAVSFWIMSKILSAVGNLMLIGAMLWLGSVWMSSLSAYNSETIGVLFMVVALKYIVAYSAQTVSLFSGRYGLFVYLLGFWLGCFPFVKFQLVPMGMVLGLWLFVQMVSIPKQRTAVLWLIVGAFTPVLVVLICFVSHDALPIFWNDYFNNYFVYSFTDEFSKNEILHRFSWQNIYLFLTKTKQGQLFWCGLTLSGLVAVGFGIVKWSQGGNKLFWPMLLWLATFYAVLQAGNHFAHYLLLLIIPTLWLVDVFGGQFHKIKWLPMLFFMVVSAQTLANTYARYAVKPFWNMKTVHAIAAEVRRLTQPHQKVVVWGYLDHIYTLSRRPMGYRSPYTFWVYFPSSQQQFRIGEFIQDLQQNQPTLFVDIFRQDLMDGYFAKGKWQQFPDIKQYIETHYTPQSNVEGVMFYVRKKEIR